MLPSKSVPDHIHPHTNRDFSKRKWRLWLANIFAGFTWLLLGFRRCCCYCYCYYYCFGSCCCSCAFHRLPPQSRHMLTSILYVCVFVFVCVFLRATKNIFNKALATPQDCRTLAPSSVQIGKQARILIEFSKLFFLIKNNSCCTKFILALRKLPVVQHQSDPCMRHPTKPNQYKKQQEE